MWFSVALMKFHWSGFNWHVFNQSECRNCCLYIIIQKIAPQAKSGKYFQIWFFPGFRGKKWRRSEHAHASYPGLFFRPPGFSPYMGREERRVQGLDYGNVSWGRESAQNSLDPTSGDQIDVVRPRSRRVRDGKLDHLTSPREREGFRSFSKGNL